MPLALGGDGELARARFRGESLARAGGAPPRRLQLGGERARVFVRLGGALPRALRVQRGGVLLLGALPELGAQRAELSAQGLSLHVRTHRHRRHVGGRRVRVRAGTLRVGALRLLQKCSVQRRVPVYGRRGRVFRFSVFGARDARGARLRGQGPRLRQLRPVLREPRARLRGGGIRLRVRGRGARGLGVARSVARARRRRRQLGPRLRRSAAGSARRVAQHVRNLRLRDGALARCHRALARGERALSVLGALGGAVVGARGVRHRRIRLGDVLGFRHVPRRGAFASRGFSRRGSARGWCTPRPLAGRQGTRSYLARCRSRWSRWPGARRRRRGAGPRGSPPSARR